MSVKPFSHTYCSDSKIYARKVAAAVAVGEYQPDLFYFDGDEKGVWGLRSRRGPPSELLWQEESQSSDTFCEGAVNEIQVNKYERSTDARNACIARFTATCIICGFNFNATFGPMAAGFIHVHHVKPLSEIGEKYRVDPIKDLRPACPNCHAVIHMGGKCRTIEEVRKLLEENLRNIRCPNEKCKEICPSTAKYCFECGARLPQSEHEDQSDEE